MRYPKLEKVFEKCESFFRSYKTDKKKKSGDWMLHRVEILYESGLAERGYISRSLGPQSCFVLLARRDSWCGSPIRTAGVVQVSHVYRPWSLCKTGHCTLWDVLSDVQDA